MQLIPAGIVLVLCLRRLVLAAERKLASRRRAAALAAGGAGVVSAASMPFCARWLAVIERPLMRPVGVKGFRDWTWLQFVLLNFTVWSAVALNLVRLRPSSLSVSDRSVLYGKGTELTIGYGCHV